MSPPDTGSLYVPRCAVPPAAAFSADDKHHHLAVLQVLTLNKQPTVAIILVQTMA